MCKAEMPEQKRAQQGIGHPYCDEEPYSDGIRVHVCDHGVDAAQCEEQHDRDKSEDDDIDLRMEACDGEHEVIGIREIDIYDIAEGMCDEHEPDAIDESIVAVEPVTCVHHSDDCLP